MNDDIHSLIGAYAVDAVSEDERYRFEQHLSACTHCQAELVGLQAVAGSLASASAVTPPPSLRANILQQIGTVRPLPPLVSDHDDEGDDGGPAHDRPAPSPVSVESAPASIEQARERRRRHGVRRFVAAAVAAAAIVVGGLTWHPWTGSAPTQVSASQQVLHASDAQRYVKHLGQTTATVVRSKKLDQSVLVADNMAPPPAGHAYQLWYQTPAGKMVSAGLMPANASGATQTVLLNGAADKATGVGITVEPAGGSTSPTTTPVALFSFST
ncbi:anti-sigma factor [Leekyejoonella antrihumi]|uniref:Regulator of SigK n=1 Tax=Leekyejoonella antrihumi TaxID=1660198 RepID=A0A563E1I0_9MICO|nr:anti-sigma factor [Leekyejoonella antrihumi]TWP36388.1 anti-sigma factor [Leekyejoonella antrihumi]